MDTFLLILHVIGAGTIIGVIMIALVLSFKKTIPTHLATSLPFIFMFGTIASIWQLLTGIGLYLGEPEEFKDSRVFWVKLIAYVISGVIASTVIKRKLKGLSTATMPVQRNAGFTFWIVLFSLIILTIVACGVILVEA